MPGPYYGDPLVLWMNARRGDPKDTEKMDIIRRKFFEKLFHLLTSVQIIHSYTNKKRIKT